MVRRKTQEADGWARVVTRRPAAAAGTAGGHGGPGGGGGVATQSKGVGLCWSCPSCGMPENWPGRDACRRCLAVPTYAARRAAEVATYANQRLGALKGVGGGVSRPGAAAPPAPGPSRPKRSRWADGPPGGGAAAAAENPGASPPAAGNVAAARAGKEQVAGLRQAAETLKSLGLLQEAEALDVKAAARQAELDAERPIVDRFKAADDVVRHRSKEVAAAKAAYEKAEAAAAVAKAALEAAATGLAAAETEAAKLRELLGGASGLVGCVEGAEAAAVADSSAGWKILAALLAGRTTLDEVRQASLLAMPAAAAAPLLSQEVPATPLAATERGDPGEACVSGSEAGRPRRARSGSRSPRPSRRAGTTAAADMDVGDIL